MPGSHHSLIPLGSLNLLACYTPVYFCPLSTSSTYFTLSQKEIEPMVPQSLSNPFDYCCCIVCVALVPRASIDGYKQTRKTDEARAYVLLSRNQSGPLKR
ncbi:hypothetical protein HKD37_08G023030 [Glycine soja]